MEPATLGVELPCRHLPPHDGLLMVLHHRQVLGCYARRTGRLLPPRHLGRELKGLLSGCEQQVRARIKALPAGRAAQAEDMAKEYKAWRKQVEADHLTGHYLRVPHTEQFVCWQLPVAVHDQLVRQHTTPCEPIDLTLVLVLPVTPCLRLLDKVSVYHHAPGRNATGHWVQLPDDHVQACLCGWSLVVVVQLLKGGAVPQA